MGKLMEEKEKEVSSRETLICKYGYHCIPKSKFVTISRRCYMD